jgi:isoleucyl-tRNA synthetase
VHLADWPAGDEKLVDAALDKRFAGLMQVRGEVAREIEKMRAAKTIGSSLEVAVELFTENSELRALLDGFGEKLSGYFITSDVSLASVKPEGAVQGTELKEIFVRVSPSAHAKCERCWNLRKSVGSNQAHPGLCERCAKVVSNL